MPTTRIAVVADPDVSSCLCRWLGEAGLTVAPVDVGAVEALRAEPPDVLLLTSTHEKGDPLALARLLRASGDLRSLVIIGGAQGPVKNALDALEYGATRFLARPVRKQALVFAVRSCVDLGHAGVVRRLDRSVGAMASTKAAIAQVSPAPAAAPLDLPDIARHAFSSHLDDVMRDAIDAHLSDSISEALALPPGDDADDDDEGAASPLAPSEAVTVTASRREPTLVLPGPAAPRTAAATAAAVAARFAEVTALNPPSPRPRAPALRPEARSPAMAETMATPPPPPRALTPSPAAAPAPAAPEESETGTFASELRRRMSDVEQRLFGDRGEGRAPEDEPDEDIDIDAIPVDGTIANPPPAAAAEAPLESDDEESTSAGRAPLLERGDLLEDDVPTLVARLWREAFSGKVVFRRTEAEKIVFFEEGRAVFARSNVAQDRMGDLLYREGKITREQHARSREILAETGRRMGEILVEMGFLKRRELLPAVRRHVEDVLYSLFSWESGAWEAAPGASAEDEKIRLTTHPAAVVLEGIRRKIGLDRLRQRLGPREAVLTPLKRDDIAGVLAEADLSPEERQAADLFDGRRTLADVVAAGRVDETAVYQLGYALVALGVAVVLDRGHAAEAPRGGLVGAGDLEIDRQRVLAKYAHIVEADYFTLLGVRRDATAFELRRAVESAHRDYAPEAFAAEIQRELAGEIAEIALVVDEAYRVLKDEPLRSSYVRHLVD